MRILLFAYFKNGEGFTGFPIVSIFLLCFESVLLLIRFLGREA